MTALATEFGLNLTNYTDRQAWLEARAAGIGASEIAAILGLSPWDDAMSVYLDKMGIAPEKEQTESMEWGLRHEPAIAQKYQEETGRELWDPGSYAICAASEDEPAPFLCTLDRVIPRAEGRDGPGVLEIKTTSAFMEDEWAEGPPPNYVAQMQQQLLVTGFSWGSSAVLIGGNKFLWCDFERDQDQIDKIREYGSVFWNECFLKEQPPKPGGSKKTAELIADLFPIDNGESKNLGGEFLTLDDQLIAVKAKLSQLMQEKQQLESTLKAAIGEAQVGYLPNGVSYSWKTQTRAEHVVKESKFRTLRRHKAGR